MTESTTGTPRRSSLHGEHVAAGATMGVHGGWEIPVRFSGELEEHGAVREAVGIFDLSQMGEIRVTGPDAPQFLAHTLISAIKPIALGKAKYTMIVQEDGGIIDDLIAYRLGVEEFMLVQNAGNCDEVFATLEERVGGYDVELQDRSADTALLAVQGPRAKDLLMRTAPEDTHATIADMRYYSCTSLEIEGVDMLVARTGYTGEDGFELFVPVDRAVEVWRGLLAHGDDLGVRPCGLACRDTLRLEAGMPLYGKELTRSRTPLEARARSVMGPTKGRFIGKKALYNQPEPAQLLTGLEIRADEAPADGAILRDSDGNEVGVITSATVSPTLGTPIAMAYVDKWCTHTGTELTVAVGGRAGAGEGADDGAGEDAPTAEDAVAVVVPLPFYNHKKRRGAH